MIHAMSVDDTQRFRYGYAAVAVFPLRHETDYTSFPSRIISSTGISFLCSEYQHRHSFYATLPPVSFPPSPRDITAPSYVPRCSLPNIDNEKVSSSPHAQNRSCMSVYFFNHSGAGWKTALSRLRLFLILPVFARKQKHSRFEVGFPKHLK